MDWDAPLIIIGAGRSGSTLLVRMLDAHPQLSCKGETDFLLARLWQEVWERRFWQRWQAYVASGPGSSRAPQPAEGPELQAEERRVAGLCSRFLAELLGVDPACRRWGFKEVWNGGAAHQYSWEPYDRVFPRATWVHLVRHPLDFAGSCAGWNQDALTPAYLQARLADWVGMLRRNSERQSTGRYHLLRYEDLVSNPAARLRPVLAAMDLEWDDRCLQPLAERRLASQRDRTLERQVVQKVELPAELVDLASELGYELRGV